MALDYWYDAQLRRYWLQFTRIFEGFQYETGLGANGTRTLRTVPVSLATKNRQVGHILRNNSENTMLSTPRITCEMTSIQMSPERRQTPNHVSTANVWERAIDPTTNQYTGEPGRRYSVERIMAIPYDVTMRVNLWTSNENQKHQLMEQMLVLFNPSIDIQTGDNPVDWTSLTIVELDEVQWTNRELPIGTDDDIEIATLTFKMPIWLSPPAKIRKQNIIHQIITNISQINNDQGQEIPGEYAFSTTDLHTRSIITPGNHQTTVDIKRDEDGSAYFEVTLLTQEGLEEDDKGDLLSWRKLLMRQGEYRKGVSQFRLKTTNDLDDHDSDIIGIFDFHPTLSNKITWTPDMETLPRNTLPAINAMISPNAGHQPGVDMMPAAANGQRYLLADDLPSTTSWSGLKARANDIITYSNGVWSVAFNASGATEDQVVLNMTSGRQLRWTGEMWIDAVAGSYYPGYWRVFL